MSKDWDAYEKAMEPTTSLNWEPQAFDRNKRLRAERNHDPAMVGASGFERVEGDQYWTEPWVTQALLNRIKFRGVIWEPACGRGDMVDVLKDAGYAVWSSDVIGDKLGCKGALEIDFRKPSSPRGELFSIVTNPPYRYATSFIRNALEATERGGGMVAMLLRNEFDCAAGRRGLFEAKQFAAKLVLTKRPRWAEGHQTASPRHNFAWYVWDHWHYGSAKIEWLP